MKMLKLYGCAIIWRHAGYRIQTDPSPHPSPLGSLSSVRFTNSVGICGNGFWVQTRRERRAYLSAVCKERTTKSEPKRHAARRVAPHLAFGFVAPRSQIAADMLPRRAAPKAKCGATNAHPICEQHTRTGKYIRSVRRLPPEKATVETGQIRLFRFRGGMSRLPRRRAAATVSKNRLSPQPNSCRSHWPAA